MTDLRVFVPGRPAPQGSKRPRPIYRGRGNAREFTGKVAVTESAGDALKTWRDDVRGRLLDEHGQPWVRFDTAAVVVHLDFLMPRPRSHYRTGRNAHLLRNGAPRHHTSKLDLDKLSRALLDAITSAGIWHDDGQVVRLFTGKYYAGIGQTPGCLIHIRTMEEA